LATESAAQGFYFGDIRKMKICIVASYKDTSGKWRSIDREVETNLTIPQLRRIRRKHGMQVYGGVVTLFAAERVDSKERAEFRVKQLYDLINFAHLAELIPSDASRRTWNERHNSHRSNFRAFDHDLVWRTTSKAVVYTNEPYGTGGFVEWVRITGWPHLILDKEHSFYYPDSTFLIITTQDKTADLDAIADAWVARHD
jgi:hypothetical protein